ncbi:MAG: hypothetical protein AVDCRST_MAG56-3066 [uncultured Cytophagales bacterium]|uniref:ABC transporter permease n=1 Tax=uncultured Cytophagales bacterium TaxID=158755 RepID=A0A6J4JA58_9SPHI|nr:MAG: hypothetical protein AVDCRST_MAG56-3066 [uncultured Cytophagales bacterium]
MKRAVQYLGRSLSVEVLKCRRTLVFWLAAGAPFFMVFLAFNLTFFHGENFIRQGHNPWGYLLYSIRDLWGAFLFPMYIALQSVLLLNIEHQANTWKHVYSLAVPRWTVYFGKLLLGVGLVCFCIFMLYVFTEGAGLLLALLRPEFGFDKYNVSVLLLRGYSKMLLSGLGIVALQHLISTRYHNFLVPAAFGFAMTVAATALGGQRVIEYLPYAFPALALKDDNMTYFPLFNRPVYLSLAVFVSVSAGGYWALSRRDVE